MAKYINDWKPEVKSFLNALVAEGFVLESVDNGDGDETCTTVAQAVELVTATDESHIYFTSPKIPGRTLSAFLVLGNSPGELVCDYSAPGGEAGKALNAVCEAHGEKWEGKDQPRKLQEA